MLEDRRLLRRLRAGDRDALRRVYEKYLDDLLRVAASLLSEPQAAEDCLHDAFVHFAGAVDRLQIRSLKGYLVSCVANRARDQLRKRTKESAWRQERGPTATVAVSPVKSLVRAEESARVLEAITRLPYEQREVFVLRVHAGMKFRTIAGLQDVSINCAQSRYRYALARLRAILDKGDMK
jgi:RNA polymerase sigma-70 factor (ECF subfamily)